MVITRDELLAALGEVLSEDIRLVIEDEEIELEDVVDATIPKGSPGSQFHRPFLQEALESLTELDEPLDVLTCLQVCSSMGWSIGIIEDEE